MGLLALLPLSGPQAERCLLKLMGRCRLFNTATLELTQQGTGNDHYSELAIAITPLRRFDSRH